MKSSEITVSTANPAALHQVKDSWSPWSKASDKGRARMRKLWASAGFNHDVAAKLRYELDMIMLRTRCAVSRTYRRQIGELAARRDLLVHLGCGNALLPGWINLDCYPPPAASGIEVLTLDLRKGLPFADGSVQALFSEHFLEHLPVETVRKVILPAILRCLKPGGKVRIGLPDGEYFVNQYVAYRSGQSDPLFERHRHGKTPMTMLNEIAHGFGHYFAYDFDTLKGLLSDSGFVGVHRCAAGQTTVDYFKDKDRIDEWRNAMTLYVEAEAPSSPA